MTTNNLSGRVRWWGLLALVCLGGSLAGCFSNGDGDSGSPGSSSGSHWLACDEDGDCAAHGKGATCGDENVCVDASGTPIDVTGTAGAGGSAGAAGTSGSGATGGTGGSGGYQPCAGKSCGDECSVCESGDSDCVENNAITACTGPNGLCLVVGAVDCSGGSADAGMGFALPGCVDTSAGVGTACNGRDDEPTPECCAADGAHLTCEFEACTASIPASCSGKWTAVVGSSHCGGYQPCASKNCGDACTLCAPSDTDCVETNVLKVCTGTGGMCVAGAVDCSPPEKCDPLGANTCGDGMACCEVGRCGPVGTLEGQCEAADPKTGGCKPCECASQPGGCPICNSPDTPILTPTGERAIADLHEGDLVLSMDHGTLVAVPILRTRQVLVHDHAVARITFADGRQVEISGSHPTADGRRLDALVPGDLLGEAHVVSVEMVPYQHDRTYDILPASHTGTYVASGALIGSTLAVPGVY